MVVVSITIEYSKGSFKVSLGAFHPFNGASAFTAELIVALTFERSIEAFPIFQLIDVSVLDENDSCSVFQKFAHGQDTFIKSTSFNDGSFQLVVKIISILISEGAQFASATLQTFTDGDQAAPGQNANL